MIRLLHAFNINPDTWINAKEEWILHPEFAIYPSKLDTRTIKRRENISSFISIPCSFIYGVLGVRMLPFQIREPNKQERVNGS